MVVLARDGKARVAECLSVGPGRCWAPAANLNARLSVDLGLCRNLGVGLRSGLSLIPGLPCV